MRTENTASHLNRPQKALKTSPQTPAKALLSKLTRRGSHIILLFHSTRVLMACKGLVKRGREGQKCGLYTAENGVTAGGPKFVLENKRYGQDYRNRLGNDQFRGGSHGRWRAHGHKQFGRRTHDPFGGGIHQRRQPAGGAGCQAPGGYQSGEHGLFNQAVYGAALRRSDGRD